VATGILPPSMDFKELTTATSKEVPKWQGGGR